jgi:hypothetical protein
MPQITSNCPICDTLIQGINLDRCAKCGWVIGIDRLLQPQIQDELRTWGRHYYKSAVACSEKLQKTEHNDRTLEKLVGQLNRQRDDIDYLKSIVPQILPSIQEVKSILTTGDKVLDRTDRIPFTSIDSIAQQDRRPAEIPAKETVNIDRDEIEPVRADLSSKTSDLTFAQQEIISDYYHQPREFANKYKTKIANITKDSINSNRGSEDKIVVLEETSRGNYWIFNLGTDTYLVPVQDKYINQHSYTTTSTIFEGHNYTPDYEKIQLVKPAIVSIDPNTNPQTWRLQEQGELVFL